MVPRCVVVLFLGVCRLMFNWNLDCSQVCSGTDDASVGSRFMSMAMSMFMSHSRRYLVRRCPRLFQAAPPPQVLVPIQRPSFARLPYNHLHTQHTYCLLPISYRPPLTQGNPDCFWPSDLLASTEIGSLDCKTAHVQGKKGKRKTKYIIAHLKQQGRTLSKARTSPPLT